MQNWLITKVTKQLSKDLNTRVQIDHVDFSFFNKMSLEKALVEDRNKDTLLYAGKLKVRITDWFFLKDQIELKYIGLEDASIFLHRTGKEWNYEFLLSYFSSPPSSKPQKRIDLNLKKIELANVHFFKKDEWRGENQVFHVGSLKIEADKIDFNDKKIRIKNVIISQPLFSIYNYKGLRPPRTGPRRPRDTTYSAANPDKWDMTIEQLVIIDGIFKNDVQNDQDPLPYFDGEHILFGKINSTFKNFVLKEDTVTAHIALTTTERSGLMVKAFSANIKWHPKSMSFTNLDIVTNKSHLTDAFHMRYNSFDDMGDFIEKINLEGNFINSEIETDDIAFFAPELAGWKKRIFITGNIKGPISNLSARNIIIKAGKNSVLNGDILIKGIPDVERMYIDFRANDFRTTYADAVTFVPELKKVSTPKLNKIQYLRFKGNFNGFIRDFVTYGTIETNLGSVRSDINMKLPHQAEPAYTGIITTGNFDIGAFLPHPSLGKISFNGKIKGIGFNVDKIEAQLEGNVDGIDYNGYHYTNIKINGKLAKKKFNGDFVANDPELNASLNGLVDFSKDQPLFNFTADVEKANLVKLKLFNENIDLNGLVDFNFTGSTLDNFLGYARVHRASILKNGKRISFDSLTLISNKEGNNRNIQVNSNELEAFLSGDFSIKELPNTFQTFLNRYYPSYINPPTRQVKNENFSFSVKTRKIDDYLDIIDKNLKGFNDAIITGKINLKETLIDVEARVPNFSYSGFSFQNVALNGKGNLDTLTLNSKIEDIAINDSIHFPGTAINIQSSQDISSIDISTSGNKTLTSASVVGQVQTLRDGVRILFNPSHFSINGKEWTIDKGGELILSKELVATDGLKLYNESQEIYVTTSPSSTTNGNDIKIDLKKINIGDIAPFFVTSNRLEGLLTGTVDIKDPFGNLSATMQAETDQFRLDNDSIGIVKINPSYSKATGKISFSASSNNENYNFDIKGNFNLKDSTSSQLDITANLQNTNINLLEKYLSNIFSRIEGKATGQLRIVGRGKSTKYLGDIEVKDAGLLVNYTRCYYKIPQATFHFKDGYIDFGSFVINDTLNNKGEVTSGILYHQNFRDLGFDFHLRTNQLLLLNTLPSDNNQFYGTIIGKANVTFTGPLDKMELAIKGEPTDTSNIFLPIGDSRESGDADFIVWKVYGKEMQPVYTNTESDLNISLDITANRFANVSVILDELTGDIIKARGSGNLQINVGTHENMTMEGRYEIEDGEYTFSFQSIKRLFRLKKGVGNYISWNGDPERATISIVAEYDADNVRFKDLGITDISEETSSSNKKGVLVTSKEVLAYRGKIVVIATLKDRLSTPTISFQIQLPDNSPLRNDQDALNLLNTIQRDPNELNKQVSFLIVFNTFGPLTSNRTGSNNIANTAFEGIVVNTISSFLSKALTNEFSNILRNVFKDESLKVNINASLYNGTNLVDNLNNAQISLPDRTNFNFSIAKSYFKERLTFVFGSAFDFGLNSVQQSQSSFQFLPDVTAEWKLSQDGKFRLSFFYRDSYSYISGRPRNRSGTSISYRKEFDTIDELLRKKK